MEDQDGAELCYPHLLNASCRKPKHQQSDIVLMYLLFFMSVFTVTLNLLLIVSVSHFRQLHTPSNLLILSLAVSDCLFGLVTIMEAQRQTGCWFFGDVMCFLHVCVASISYSASVGVMVLVSVDRYVAICDPMHYPTRVTVTRVKNIVSACWICAVVYNGLINMESLIQPGQFSSCHGQCFVIISYSAGIFDTILSSLAPVTVMMIVYLRVFVTAVSQARAMRSHVAAVSLRRPGTGTTKKSELKAARTLGVVVAVFLMCFIPSYCLSLAQENYLDVPAASGVFLLCISPCLNPLIYALFYPWFRKAVRFIFSLQILQPGSRETSMM